MEGIVGNVVLLSLGIMGNVVLLSLVVWTVQGAAGNHSSEES